MNIKTGGCSEDCSYCSQSSRYSTPTTASRLLQNEPVIQAALKAKENGSTRFCMGAAWRDLQGRKSGFNRILEMVAEIRLNNISGMGMEVCTTLGMLTPEQARQLKEAGLTAYNHNLDTSREFYPKVITTRSYDDRLATIEAVQDAGINVCSGGILGLGETDEDRAGLIWEVATMRSHPESFPVNALVPIAGTPLENNPLIPHQTILRTIATARIAMPSTIIRLSAGRHKFTEAEQVMCFMAGANAVFTGEKMLTTPCSSWDADKEMFSRWGLEGMKSFEQAAVREKELPRYPESTSYRTVQTKITEKQLSGPEALPFDIVQEKVIDLISGYIVVGHALWNDLSVLGISHLAIDTRDTALYVPFRSILNVQTVLMEYAISQTLMLDLDPSGALPYFAVPALTLVPAKGPLPESEALKQTYDLACASNCFAQRSSIGSLLAGPGSESDEFTDVAFWCGEIDESNKEVSILQSLSLDSWVQKGRLRLYSKELAEHTFNQWILCLRHVQSRPQPATNRLPPPAQIPPWFPPMPQMGSPPPQLML
ncbi:unnamed protein product [Rhizoctonia solani]|uniref:biotin synthase n=1 Tax=Rhizoctonia solani TaxID=456999 RepID=A0A8H3GWY8_9AGAM|nr:unnamed protein product [Rhizoctonia solani]